MPRFCVCAADELTGIIKHCYMEICVSTWPTLGATIPVQLDAEVLTVVF